jgi:prephenate dehydrogenase
MRVALLGFGLIGGSIARAIHARVGDAWEIAAWSPSGQGPARAMAGGEIAIAANDPAQALAGAELVVLAAPPVDCIRLLDELHGDLRASLPTDAVVTDVASTKRQIVHRAAELDLRFVGGHPMAGTERSGYDAADPGLFVDRPWVICTDGADDAAVLPVERLVSAVGARALRMEAAAHDAAVAAISHLPLVVSAALVESVFGPGPGSVTDAAERATASDIAATGWRDMTRLAKGDVAMAAGIASTNAEALGPRVRAMRDVLTSWLEELERPGGPRVNELSSRFREARRLAAGGDRDKGRDR